MCSGQSGLSLGTVDYVVYKYWGASTTGWSMGLSLFPRYYRVSKHLSYSFPMEKRTRLSCPFPSQ